MATELLVDQRIEGGERLIFELEKEGFDVSVAFWVQSSETGLWSFFIGSSFDPSARDDSYLRVLHVASHINDLTIGLSDINLVHTKSAIAQDAIALRDRYIGQPSFVIYGKKIGDLYFENLYVYPINMANRTALRMITAHWKSKVPLEVTLRNGSVFKAIPRAIELPDHKEIHFTLLNADTNQEVTISIDDVKRLYSP